MEWLSAGIFEGVELSSDLVTVLATSTRRRLADGDLLLAPEQDNHYLYILVSGRMEVRLTRDDRKPGMHFAPGEPIGELSIIDGRKTSAYVHAVGDSEVVAIHESDFWRHLATQPNLMRNLTRLIVHRLRLTSQRMTQSLEEQLRFEHLKKELAAARDIQMGLLSTLVPLLPRHVEIDVHAQLLPAREVGGDLYDAFPIGENEVLLAVGDVSGKGMPAALFMMRTLTLLRAQSSAGTPVDQLLPNLNRLLGQGNGTDMFVTLCLAILSVDDGRLTLFNGGHLPPLLSRQGGPFAALGGTRGALLGVMPDIVFRGIELHMAPGDRIVFYSDGITEAENAARDMFTLERMCAVLNGCPVDSPMAELAGALMGAVAEFSAAVEQSDDITLLALRYLGPGATQAAARAVLPAKSPLPNQRPSHR